MEEIIFKYDINADKFKAFVGQKFTAQQIEDIISMLHMYIEIISMEEMNNRIYNNNTNLDVEIKLKGLVEFISTFSKFIKNTGQKK